MRDADIEKLLKPIRQSGCNTLRGLLGRNG